MTSADMARIFETYGNLIQLADTANANGEKELTAHYDRLVQELEELHEWLVEPVESEATA